MENDTFQRQCAVHEAERGRRRVHRVWRAPEISGAELERLCGSPDHQGVVAEVDPYPYGDAEGMLRKPDALRCGSRAVIGQDRAAGKPSFLGYQLENLMIE